MTRPWLPSDYDDERGHPLCVPSFAGACAVCMDPLGAAERVAHLECCERNFHATCLEAWFAQRRGEAREPSCPYCRTVCSD